LEKEIKPIKILAEKEEEARKKFLEKIEEEKNKKKPEQSKESFPLEQERVSEIPKEQMPVFVSKKPSVFEKFFTRIAILTLTLIILTTLFFLWYWLKKRGV